MGKGMRRRRGGKGRGQDDKRVKRQTRVIYSSNVYWICSITGTHTLLAVIIYNTQLEEAIQQGHERR